MLVTSTASRDSLGAEPAVGWGTAMLVEISVRDVEGPQVAVDSTGNAIAVWVQHDGVRESVYSNRYEVGRGWWAATLIETGDAGNAQRPQVAVDSSGNAIAVWDQFDGFRSNVYSNRYVVGTGWGEAQLVETDDLEVARYPQVAVDGSGNAIAVWVQTDFASSSVWSNRYVVGMGWGEAELIETQEVGFVEGPQVAVDEAGNAIAVWYQEDGTHWDVWSNRYEVGIGWGGAQLIETEDAGNADRPRVAVDNSGNAIAVWSQSDGTHWNICSNRYVAGTGWGEAQPIETDDDAAFLACVAVDKSGNATAVWVQHDGTRSNIHSNRYVVGTGWGEAQLIETQDVGSAEVPQVADDGSGNATVVWRQYDDDADLNIYSNRYEVGVGWGEVQLIETHVEGDEADSPQVAVGESGSAIAVWRQYDGTYWNVWSNRYVMPDTTPPPLSIDSPSDGLTTEMPVVVASGTTESGVDLAVNGITVAVDSDGSFSCLIVLVEGVNTIVATATDAWDNSATVSVSVTYVNPVHDLEDDLVDIRDELNTTQDDLDAVEEELDATKDELNTTQADLDTIEDELSATQDDLEAAEEELSSASDDLSNVKSQNTLLMAVLAAFAILAIVMTVMFLSLRKKMADMDGRPVEEETPPPPQS